MFLASDSSSSSNAFPSRARRWRSRRQPRSPAIMIETTTRPLVALLHICDSLFPIGGFGYSDGLEAATAAGAVRTPAPPPTGRGGGLGGGGGGGGGAAAPRPRDAVRPPGQQHPLPTR